MIEMDVQPIRRVMSHVVSLCCCVLCNCPAWSAQDTATVRIEVRDTNHHPMPCRIHLKDKNGQPQKADKLPFWSDHFVCPGAAAIELAAGQYTYEMERGPEYERQSGSVKVVVGRPAEIKATLKRIANLREEGWYSSDLHVHRPIQDIELLMQAEDLDFAPVITWWNARRTDTAKTDTTLFRFDGHRMYTNMAGEDEREGGALLYFGLRRPLNLLVKSREFPSPMRFVRQAHEENKEVWIDIEKPFWWDVPTWLASGEMNSIGLANNHMCRSQMYEDEAWGKPRDTTRLPNPRGNGLWTQEIYYHILNCGLRIPPSAGSASGVLPNPVGYNRVYVYLDEPFSREAWFAALARGHTFVTNGPLLRGQANGQLPGTALKLTDGGRTEIQLAIKLTSVDRVPLLEVVHNGRIVETIDCPSDVNQQHEITFTVREPGWFLVRAIADVENTFRFGSTAPWYIETKAAKHPIRKESAQFFLDWVGERIDRVRHNVTDVDQLRAVLAPHESARAFWLKRVQIADADRDD